MLHRTLSLTGPTDSNLAFASEHGAVVSGGVILEPSWLGLATDAAILAALPYMSRANMQLFQFRSSSSFRLNNKMVHSTNLVLKKNTVRAHH